MSRLFVKIWLWFWIATVLLGGALFLAERQWGVFDTEDRLEDFLGSLGQAGVAVLERRGGEGFDHWRGRTEQRFHGKLFILDDSAEDVGGRPLPPPMSRLLASRPAVDGMQRLGWRDRVVRLPLPPPAEGYTAVAFMPRGAHGVLDPPGWVRALIAAAVSALVCMALARYLSKPIRRVRAATQRLAEGDLSARVGPQMGRRRDEITQLGHDFDRMAARIQTLLDSQRRLLRDVSHELRSPLARLQVALELARQRLQDSGEDSLGRIQREAERLDELVGQVLALARLDSGADAPKRERVSLTELVRDVAEDARFEAETAGKQLESSAADGAVVAADAAWLRSAVENVVRNAVRHTPAGTAVSLSLVRSGDQWEVRVRDRGPGVPESDVERLFEPFFRVSDARERESGGYGLGLAITRRVVEAHGGSVGARNHSNGGLEVTLRLPMT